MSTEDLTKQASDDAASPAAQLFHCSCGAACTPDEYAAHRAMGHDAPVGLRDEAKPEYDLDPLEFWCDLAEVLGHPRPTKADVPALVSEVKERLAPSASPAALQDEAESAKRIAEPRYGERTCKRCSKPIKNSPRRLNRWTHIDTASIFCEAAELVDEVQHRMDQVVEAAVEWHQAGREGTEWFEAAEKLGAAIESLLELRAKPDQNSTPTGLSGSPR